MLWTEERLTELKARHEQGESSGEIAYAMHTSRNAVIGKLHRLGLRTARGAPQRTNRARRRRRKPLMVVKMPRLLPDVLPIELPLDEFEHPKPLIELTDAECHWPGRGSPATEFCAAPVFPGRPYCARHTLAAYTRIIAKVVR